MNVLHLDYGKRMRRSGYTLLEIVLVLAVILIVAALGIPALEAFLENSKLTAARDMVRARWAETRSKAMEENRAYRFAVTENTGRFRIAPDSEMYWTGDPPDDAEDMPFIVEGELPEGVLFAASDSNFTGEGDMPPPGPEYGLVLAVYLGDGTARDDAKVWFGKSGSRPFGLQLRGLTGAVTAVDNKTPAPEVEP